MFLLKPDVYNSYKKAGEISKKAKKLAKNLAQVDRPIFEIAEKVEGKIKNLGGQLAFPMNISINNIAAHYTPTTGDETLIQKDDIIKFDLGVHVNGYIADTAFTIYFGGSPHQERLLKAAKDALDSAINMIKPSVRVNEVGKEIQSTIEGYGFRPIRNLTGHSLDQFNLHSGVTVPNVGQSRGAKLSEGDAVAIEPFATNGEGFVKDSDTGSIYKFLKKRPIRFPKARKLQDYITKNYKTLPFAKRWLDKEYKDSKLDYFLRMLTSQGALHLFKAFVERQNGLVSQFEHTLIVTSDGCEITT